MNRLKLGGRYYPAVTGVAAYAIVKECPNHQGAFDCTPFCELCGGEQELTEQE